MKIKYILTTIIILVLLFNVLKADGKILKVKDVKSFSTDTSEEKYYNTDSLITDVINDPVFKDYGRLLFPVNKNFMSGRTLGELSLAWYNYIDKDKTVGIVNSLKE